VTGLLYGKVRRKSKSKKSIPSEKEGADLSDKASEDRWRQIGEAEARVAYDMTLRNELSGVSPPVRRFEVAWRRWIGCRHVMTTANGSSALYAAFFGLGIGPGDEVICPAYTWINSIGPALLLGARPIFCESDPESLLIDPEDVRRRITPRTQAIVAVHLWGNVCDLEPLLEIGREFGLPVVEDCSHAHGAMYKGRMVGTLGSVGCWSLQSSKPTSAGEGGVLATDDTVLFERACLVSQNSGFMGGAAVAGLQPWGLGMKLRAHPLGIGIASVQLERLPELNRRRRSYVEAVESGLAEIRGLRSVKVYPGAVRAGFHGFPLLHTPQECKGIPTEKVIAELNAAGVAAVPCGYPLLHLLPLFANGFDLFTRGRGPLSGDYQGYLEGALPRTENMHRHLVFLPVLSDPLPGAADTLVQKIAEVMHRLAKRH